MLVRDLAALDESMANLAPRLVRPRVEAEHVYAIAVAEVREIGYHPGDQRLDALAALDAIDAALRSGPGSSREPCATRRAR